MASSNRINKILSTHHNNSKNIAKNSSRGNRSHIHKERTRKVPPYYFFLPHKRYVDINNKNWNHAAFVGLEASLVNQHLLSEISTIKGQQHLRRHGIRLTTSRATMVIVVPDSTVHEIHLKVVDLPHSECAHLTVKSPLQHMSGNNYVLTPC